MLGTDTSGKSAFSSLPFLGRGRGGPLKRKLSQTVQPTGVERHFNADELIVSKTDPKGFITYANQVFYRIADLTEEEVIGAAHSVIRHPEMPRAIFRLLWETLESGEEIFAYVKNLAKNGDHYWVFAHVTPTFASDGSIIGYHSNRRVARREALAKIEPIYAELRSIEVGASNAKEGLANSAAHLEQIFTQLGTSYDEFIFSF